MLRCELKTFSNVKEVLIPQCQVILLLVLSKIPAELAYDLLAASFLSAGTLRGSLLEILDEVSANRQNTTNDKLFQQIVPHFGMQLNFIECDVSCLHNENYSLLRNARTYWILRSNLLVSSDFSIKYDLITRGQGITFSKVASRWILEQKQLTYANVS